MSTVDGAPKEAHLNVSGDGEHASLTVDGGISTGTLDRDARQSTDVTQFYRSGGGVAEEKQVEQAAFFTSGAEVAETREVERAAAREQKILIVSKDGGSDRLLSDVKYGVYGLLNEDGSQVLGGYFDGNRTPTQTQPAGSVKATYSGNFIGVEVGEGKEVVAEKLAEGPGKAQSPRLLTGAVGLEADFGSGKVAGSISHMAYDPGTAPEEQRVEALRELRSTGYSISLNGDITGTSYKGNATFVPDVGEEGPREGIAAKAIAAPVITTDPSSKFSGAFYGANAAETAGAVAAKGTVGAGTERETSIAVTGSYGAAKVDPAAQK